MTRAKARRKNYEIRSVKGFAGSNWFDCAVSPMLMPRCVKIILKSTYNRIATISTIISQYQNCSLNPILAPVPRD